MAQPFQDLILGITDLRFAYPLIGAGTTDLGPNGLTLTANGSPTSDGSGAVLGDAATAFNGSSQSMSRAHHAAFNFGLSDYTIGCFIKPANTSAGSRFFLCHNGDGGTGMWEMWQSGTALNSRFNGTISVSATGVLDTSWQFVAFTADRDGNGRMWRNGAWAAAGVSIAAASAVAQDATETMWIGRRESTGYFPGSMAWAFGAATLLTDVQLLAIYEARDDAALAAARPIMGGGFF